MSENNRPVKKVRAGAISASVFKNTGNGKNGAVEFNTVVLQRSYKDKDGKWQNTGSLRINDLPKAALVLNKVYEHFVCKDVGLNAAVEEIQEEEVMY
jgi:hypothetical protein